MKDNPNGEGTCLTKRSQRQWVEIARKADQTEERDIAKACWSLFPVILILYLSLLPFNFHDCGIGSFSCFLSFVVLLLCYLHTLRVLSETSSSFRLRFLLSSFIFAVSETSRLLLHDTFSYVDRLCVFTVTCRVLFFSACDVTYYMHSNPLLSFIPTFLMNWLVVRFPSIIDKVRASIKSKPILDARGTHAAAASLP